MIPEAAVEAAFGSYVGGNEVSGPDIAGDFLTREQLRTILEAAAPHMLAGVTALADDWERQGEYDMAYSKSVADQEVAIQLLQAGAQMVDDARLIRNALEGK